MARAYHSSVLVGQGRNQELGTELVNQVNTKAAIMRQFEKRDMSLRAQEEVDRMKELDRVATCHRTNSGYADVIQVACM